MATFGTDKVTIRRLQADGSSLFDQHQIDHEQVGGTITDQISILSVGQASAPADVGRLEVWSNNAAYVGVVVGYLRPPGGYAPATPFPSGPVAAANRKGRS